MILKTSLVISISTIQSTPINDLLVYGVVNKNVILVNLALYLGADANTLCNEYQSVLDKASEDDVYDKKETNSLKILELLIYYNAEVNPSSTDWSDSYNLPLATAISSGRIEKILLLLEAGADPGMVDRRFGTMLRNVMFPSRYIDHDDSKKILNLLLDDWRVDYSYLPESYKRYLPKDRPIQKLQRIVNMENGSLQHLVLSKLKEIKQSDFESLPYLLRNTVKKYVRVK